MQTELSERLTKSVSPETIAELGPIIQSANAACKDRLVAGVSTWSGVAALDAYRDVIRSMEGLATLMCRERRMPSACDMRIVGQIPARLLRVISLLNAEAYPATINAAADKKQAKTDADCWVMLSNRVQVKSLMVTHDIMRCESMQHRELQDWGDLEGCLVFGASTMPVLFGSWALSARHVAPACNTQARMVADEAKRLFKELQGTLRYCATH